MVLEDDDYRDATQFNAFNSAYWAHASAQLDPVFVNPKNLVLPAPESANSFANTSTDMDVDSSH